MKKARLTMENIKTDLRIKMKHGYKWLAFTSSMFFVILVIIFVVAAFRVDVSGFLTDFIYCLVGEVVLLYVTIRQLKNLIMLHENIKKMNCIVMDKLVYAEEKDRYRRTTRDERFCLHFLQYGKYIIPKENYKWSSDFSMSDVGVYNYANNGDEFYLVLSKPNNGKILFAYNAKMFEMG